MVEDNTSKGTELLNIQLMGAQSGIPLESLVPALQRIFPRKTEAQVREALKRLPVVLARGVKKGQALKVKKFLEASGAVLKITYAKPATAPETVTPREAPAPEKVSAEPAAKPDPSGADRRRKPRVHPGIDIQPMGIGDILDKSFRLLRQYFWLFFIIVLIPQGCLFLITKGAQMLAGPNAAQSLGLAGGIGIGIGLLVAVPVFVILQFWAMGALIYAVSETYLGHTTSVKESFGAMRRLIWKLLGTMILWGIFVFGPFMLMGIFFAILIPIAASGGTSSWVIGILIFIAVGVCIWLFFRLFLNWLLVDKVVVLEAKGGMAALRRSKELMTSSVESGFGKKPKSKGALILFVGFLLAAGFQLVFQIPMSVFMIAAPGNIFVMTIGEILNIGASCLATVFTAIAMILFYYDIRLRKEGFDLRMMAENL